MNPFSVISFVFTTACHLGLMGTECKVDARCFNQLNYLSCWQQNYGSIHTKAYMTSIKLGHNQNYDKKGIIIPYRRKDLLEEFTGIRR